MLIIITLVLLLAAGCSVNADAAHDELERYRAEVIGVVNDEITSEGTNKTYPVQYLTIRIKEGPYAGREFQTDVFIDTAAYKTFSQYQKGDMVEAELTLNDQGIPESAMVTTLIRVPYIIGLAAAFLILLGIIGRMKGLKTIAALVFTVGAVVLILVPLLSGGKDPILAAAFVCIIVTVFTLFMVGGFNRKSLSAVLGTISGLIIAAAIALIVGSLTRITGIETEEVGLLAISGVDFVFDFQGILTAGILIGCLGAVMDVAMSVSSSIQEVHYVNASLDKKQLFKSGMAVGRDIMGTMANTLILAYTGGALMLMVVWSVYGISFWDMLNKGFIVIEVIKALCGSFGMMFTIPLTALFASRIISFQPEEKPPKKNKPADENKPEPHQKA